MFPMLDRMRRSRFWWTNGQMGCTLLMTKWRVFWLPTEMQTLWPSLGIWIIKSSTLFEKRLSHETAIGQLKMISASVRLGRFGTLDEIAKLLCFWHRDDRSYITGAELFVDGGFRTGATRLETCGQDIREQTANGTLWNEINALAPNALTAQVPGE